MNQSLITWKSYRVGRLTGLAVLLGLSLLISATGAKAGCALPIKAGGAPAIPFVSPAAAHGEGERDEHASIVGLWHALYTATSDDNFPPGGPYPPTPFQFLESFKTWHGDGTEFENAFLPPAGGNICFGVWREVSEHRVKLHHIGLMFGADGSLSAIFTVDELVKVGRDGNNYTGTFEFQLWPPSYDAVGVGKPISVLKGTVAATRVVVE